MRVFFFCCIAFLRFIYKVYAFFDYYVTYSFIIFFLGCGMYTFLGPFSFFFLSELVHCCTVFMLLGFSMPSVNVWAKWSWDALRLSGDCCPGRVGMVLAGDWVRCALGYGGGSSAAAWVLGLFMSGWVCMASWLGWWAVWVRRRLGFGNLGV